MPCVLLSLTAESNLVRRLLLAFVLVAGLFVIAGASPPKAEAVGPHGCTLNEVEIWPDANFQGSPIGWSCNSIPNLAAVPGPCFNSYNDCVSSIKMWFASGRCVTFYRDKNYQVTLFSRQYPPAMHSLNIMPPGTNDTITSFHFSWMDPNNHCFG